MTWGQVALADLADIQGGIQKQPKRAPRLNAHPFLRVANVTSRGLELSDVHRIELFGDELERLRLQPGDLLVVEGNGSASQIGRAAVWDGSIQDCVHQNHLIRVRPRGLLLPSYLGLVWNSPAVRDELSAVASSTSGLHTLSVAKLKRIVLPVPPMREQVRIVEILEDHLSRLDAGNRDLTMALNRAEALRDSTLSALFADAGGEVLQLGEVASWSSGGTPKAGEPAYYEGGDIPWCNSGDLNDAHLPTVPKTITQLGLENSTAKWVPAGSVLVAMYGATIGRVAINGAPMTTNQAVAAARPTPHVMTADFLFWFLRSQRRGLRSAGKGGAQPNISQGVLKAWPVPVPGLDAQAAIAARAHEADGLAWSLGRDVAILGRRSEILRRSALAAAFAGKLTGRRTDTEVIEELARV